MQKQKLQQKLGFNLSPQQIQFLSLLQIPLASLNSRIQDELEDNPALEEGENSEDISLDELEEDNPNSYKYRQNNTPDFTEVQISNSEESLSDHLKKQLLLLNLREDDLFLTEYLIDSLDNNGWINRELFSISDDLLINLNLEFSEQEIEKYLSVIQTLEPLGVGARNLQECLLIQLKNKEQNELVELSILVLENQYERFSKKNFEGLIRELEISEMQLKEVYELVEKLNPFPASNFIKTATASYVTPDFLVTILEEKNIVTLTKRSGKELKVSASYKKMIEGALDVAAKEFLKQKIESANWFKNAILQREETLLNVMNAIVNFQEKYFLSGEDEELKPMILADIANIVNMNISTISRVTNSKYAQTFFGTFLLKDLFSEAYRKDNGELISTKVIKSRLKEIIEMEDKKHPYTDVKLAELLGENEYHIARRTVAKYREGLGIQTSKYRREL
ncbi:MAG: RNA polymerase factor sigma-54 [Flavobacteriales bacterium]|jgi:RNA polymerase sigma-54 factor|nr:RNA polymerase factor sigma-54 [Flavobacteriales bacterium]